MRIFVFGSNLAGRHGKGAALCAKNEHGAIYGNGVGIQGSSYAIPTKGWNMEILPLDIIKSYVDVFIEFALDHQEMTFQVTRIGCGLAGYKDSDIAPMFALAPKNCILPDGWRKEEKVKKLIYAGIGSRETPEDVLAVMRSIGIILAKKGYTLRSGGARGADTAFERGCDIAHGKKEIFLPADISDDQRREASEKYYYANMASRAAMKKWEDWYARLLLRNVLQVFGAAPLMGPDPVDFVVFWAPIVSSNPGDVTGGTRWAVQLAVKHGIPVNNLADAYTMDKTLEWIGKNKMDLIS